MSLLYGTAVIIIIESLLYTEELSEMSLYGWNIEAPLWKNMWEIHFQ